MVSFAQYCTNYSANVEGFLFPSVSHFWITSLFFWGGQIKDIMEMLHYLTNLISKHTNQKTKQENMLVDKLKIVKWDLLLDEEWLRPISANDPMSS